MVMVDIYVPAVDKNYNFSLNEDVQLADVITEITEMIEQKERTVLHGDRNGINLYSRRTSTVLPRGNTLAECYVTNGTQLLLV